MEMFEAEELILSMAEIVYENRRLRRELKEALEYKQKYKDLIDSEFERTQSGIADLLRAAIRDTSV